MSVENLINLVRLGKQLTPAQSRAVASQLEPVRGDAVGLTRRGAFQGSARHLVGPIKRNTNKGKI